MDEKAVDVRMLKKLFLFMMIGVLVLMPACREQKSGGAHKEIYGTVISYEETESGLVFTMTDKLMSQTYNKSYTKDILVTDITLFSDDALKGEILSKKVGLYVYVDSEYLENRKDELYPAMVIYRAEEILDKSEK